MKKIIFLIFTALAIVSCCNIPQKRDEQTEAQTEVTKVRRGGIVEEVEIKGHIYLVFSGSYKGNIIHAEHCPCKNK